MLGMLEGKHGNAFICMANLYHVNGCTMRTHLIRRVDLVFALALHLDLGARQLEVIYEGQQLRDHAPLHIAGNGLLLACLSVRGAQVQH